MEVDSTDTSRDRDALWLKQIADGNREAFEKLYGEYQKRLFRYFLRLVSVTEAAEELTNDVLVEVWKKAGDFRVLSKVSTWVFGIAHHKAMNELRSEGEVSHHTSLPHQPLRSETRRSGCFFFRTVCCAIRISR
jgi:DNA-directed RNA polymerase specialized sigma24 family protein